MEQFVIGSKELSSEVVLPPFKQGGWVLEIKATMSKGGILGYEYTAEKGVSFNLHSHHGKEVRYHVRAEAEVSAGAFSAPEDHHYYAMWENKLPKAVRVKYRLFRS